MVQYTKHTQTQKQYRSGQIDMVYATLSFLCWVWQHGDYIPIVHLTEAIHQRLPCIHQLWEIWVKEGPGCIIVLTELGNLSKKHRNI